jgi:anti-anti-sigma regulatory factor
MLIDSSFKNGYQVLRIQQKLGYGTAISDIQTAIVECLRRGLNNIAIAFSPADHLYTPPIRILVQSYQAISSNNGKLALIAPTKEMMQEILDILKLLGLADKINLLQSEDELAS